MDKAEKVNIFANEYLEQIANDANNSKIVIAKYNFETQGLMKEDIFGAKSERFNRIHLNGK